MRRSVGNEGLCPECGDPIPAPGTIMLPVGPGPFPCYCWNGRVTEQALRPNERRYSLAARRRIVQLMAMLARGMCSELVRQKERHRGRR